MISTKFDNRERIINKFKEAFGDILEDIDEILENDNNLAKTIEAILDKMEIEKFVNSLASKGIKVVYVLEYDETVEIYEENDEINFHLYRGCPLDEEWKDYFKKRVQIYEGDYDLTIYDIYE